MLVKSTYYKVTFESNGGSEVASLQAVEYGTTITALEKPLKDGYTFGGWFKEPVLTNVWNFAVDAVTDNITLYAKWTSGSGINNEYINQIYPNPNNGVFIVSGLTEK